jgi:hypothetical protein
MSRALTFHGRRLRRRVRDQKHNLSHLQRDPLKRLLADANNRGSVKDARHRYGRARARHGNLLGPSFVGRREVADVASGPYLPVGPLPDIEKKFTVGNFAPGLRIIQQLTTGHKDNVLHQRRTGTVVWEGMC